jgi:hypothetical protein
MSKNILFCFNITPDYRYNNKIYHYEQTPIHVGWRQD